ncbi:hypothetical protein DTO212C5_7950 [Paecilomyces variotii]|nr:hypothetical protein DTO212C5_7950 [Paecilomyces variotii]
MLAVPYSAWRKLWPIGYGASRGPRWSRPPFQRGGRYGYWRIQMDAVPSIESFVKLEALRPYLNLYGFQAKLLPAFWLYTCCSKRAL